MSFMDLSSDDLVSILYNLPIRDRCRMMAVSKLTCAASRDTPALWTKISLGQCESIDEEDLSRIINLAKGQITHLEVLNAPITGDCLRESETLQWLDVRGCKDLNINHDNSFPAMVTCRIAGTKWDPSFVMRNAAFLAAGQGSQEPCYHCRELATCEKCTGFDCTLCDECDEWCAPWRNCAGAVDGCSKLCGNCAYVPCKFCGEAYCSDHAVSVDTLECTSCDEQVCFSCFALVCEHCTAVSCEDCLYETDKPGYMICSHCSVSTCEDCWDKSDRHYVSCSDCHESACEDCTLKLAKCYMLCDFCHKGKCSDCAFKGSEDFIDCMHCFKRACSKCEDCSFVLPDCWKCNNRVCSDCWEERKMCCDCSPDV